MWSGVFAWLGSDAGARVIDGAVVPFAAIVVAGVLGAWIGRRAVRATGDRIERAAAVDAVTAAVTAADATTAARFVPDRAGRIAADVRLRMLPLPGATLAADWTATALAAHERGDADGPSAAVIRDRLLEWIARPRRATALFGPPRSEAAPATPAAAPKPAPKRSATSAPAPDVPALNGPGSDGLAEARRDRAGSTPATPRVLDEPDSGPLTAPVLLRREPDPALLAAVEREFAGGAAPHARHARADGSVAAAESLGIDRAAPHAGASHREPAPAPAAAEEDDPAEVEGESAGDAPGPVLVSSLTDRRFASETLVPDGAVPVTRSGHRPAR